MKIKIDPISALFLTAAGTGVMAYNAVLDGHPQLGDTCGGIAPQ